MSRSVQVSSIPTVTIFVRHSSDCPRTGDEFYKNCKCRKHLRWSHGGEQYRQSAKTRTWAIAEDARRKIEAQFATADPSQAVGQITVEPQARPTIQRALELFLLDKRTQGMDAAGLKKYERELRRFCEFMGKRG